LIYFFCHCDLQKDPRAGLADTFRVGLSRIHRVSEKLSRTNLKGSLMQWSEYRRSPRVLTWRAH
jgi:hypothetical protein